jgi:hypothetical protein
VNDNLWLTHSNWKLWPVYIGGGRGSMRISTNHNSLGCEQPLGLDVEQSPNAMDTNSYRGITSHHSWLRHWSHSS